MITDDDEREAREWLRDAKNERLQRHNYLVSACYSPDDDAKHRATILALLDRPTLPHPEELTDVVMVAMLREFQAAGEDSFAMRAAYRTLYDHYMQPPAPVKVEAWTLRLRDGRLHGVYPTKEEALLVGNELHFGSRIVRLVEDRDGR